MINVSESHLCSSDPLGCSKPCRCGAHWAHIRHSRLQDLFPLRNRKRSWLAGFGNHFPYWSSAWRRAPSLIPTPYSSSYLSLSDCKSVASKVLSFHPASQRASQCCSTSCRGAQPYEVAWCSSLLAARASRSPSAPPSL